MPELSNGSAGVFLFLQFQIMLAVLLLHHVDYIWTLKNAGEKVGLTKSLTLLLATSCLVFV